MNLYNRFFIFHKIQTVDNVISLLGKLCRNNENKTINPYLGWQIINILKVTYTVGICH